MFLRGFDLVEADSSSVSTVLAQEVSYHLIKTN